MYDLDTPQAEDSFRDMHELGFVPDPPMPDADADAAELDMAIRYRFDAFSGLTPSEYLASLETLVTV